jgi:hypothetical protein
MATRLWVGISRDGTDTVVLARCGATTVLKARLCSTPSHPRALQWLLEALALWQGAPVRAVLCAVGPGDGFGAPLLRDWFADFGGPLYTIDWADHVGHPGGADEPDELGDFTELEQLHLFDALEVGR